MMSGQMPQFGQQGQGGGLGSSNFANSLASIFSGIFGGGDPYKDAMKQFEKYLNPFFNAGQGALNPFMQQLQQMQNPTKYMANIMKNYQASPFSQIQQRDALNAANNAGSASGLTGSSALQNLAQQNARDISSQDMQQYFNNAMGINQGYLGGLQSLIGGGMNSGNMLAQLMGQGAFGQGRMDQMRWPNIFGGIAGLFGL